MATRPIQLKGRYGYDIEAPDHAYSLWCARAAYHGPIPPMIRSILGRLALPERLAFATSLPVLALIVCGSVLAVGAVHIPVLLVLACAVFGWAFAARRVVLSGWNGAALVAVLLALYTAFQAVPLPASLVSMIAPESGDIWARALRPLRESPPAWTPLSLDPGATCIEIVKWSIYAVVLAAAAGVARRHGVFGGVILIFGAAVLTALVTLAHGLVGAEALFGTYTPRYAVPRWGIAPLLNPNNLSGYLNLGAFSGFALLLARRAPIPQWLVVLGLLLVIAVSILSASRGGVVALALGVLVLALVARRAHRDDPFEREAKRETSGLDQRSERIARLRARKQRIVPLVLAAVGGLLLAMMGATRATWDELLQESTEKLEILNWSRALIAEHPWFGVGRGAFETAFPAYRKQWGHFVYTYPENLVVQWITEWGIPVAAAALIALVWVLRPSRLAASSPVARAVLVGIAVVLVQNLADLALEVPAVAIALCVLLGTLWGAARRSERGQPERPQARTITRYPRLRTVVRRMRKWAAPAAALAAGSLAALWVFAARVETATYARERMHGVYSAVTFGERATFDTFASDLRAAMLRRPGEPYFPLLGALAARRTPNVDPMPWVAAALERDPGNGRAHLVLADVLARRGAVSQALLELRLALEREPNLAGPAARRAVGWTRDPTMLDRAIPKEKSGAIMAWGVARLLQQPEERAARAELLERAIQSDRALTGPRITRADDLVKDLMAAERTRCFGAGEPQCRAMLDRELRTIERIDPAACDPLMMRARLAAGSGQPDEAERKLAGGCSSCRNAEMCNLTRLYIANKLEDAARLEQAIRAFLAVICATPAACARGEETVGDLVSVRLEWGRAAEHYQRAANLDPTAQRWLRLARAAMANSEPGRATIALERAQRIGGGDPQLAARIAQQKRALVLEVLGTGAAEP
jgi:tetratricopeptide (TPR) repeat protein